MPTIRREKTAPAQRSVAAPPSGSPGALVAGHFVDGVCRDTWRPEGTRDWLLLVTHAGVGRIGYAGGDVWARPGDAILLAPGARHDYGSERMGRRWRFHWAHFLPPPEWMRWLAWPEAAPGVRRVRLDAATHAQVRRALAAAVRRGLRPSAHREELARLAVLEALVRCDEARDRGVAQTTVGRAVDPRMLAAADWMAAHLAEVIAVPDLARRAGLSTARFARGFRAAFGVPPMRYLEELRLNRAARLLELTQAKVASVAQQVGFADAFYFTLRFKRHTGRSPSAYRAARAAGRK